MTQEDELKNLIIGYIESWRSKEESEDGHHYTIPVVSVYAYKENLRIIAKRLDDIYWMNDEEKCKAITFLQRDIHKECDSS